jgi:sRNA-binding carbon storage regulator CsrA
MLVLSRKPQERVFLELSPGVWAAIILVKVKGPQAGVSLGIQAPPGVNIVREEAMSESQRDQAIENVREYEAGRRSR